MKDNRHTDLHGSLPLSKKRRESKVIDANDISDNNVIVVRNQNSELFKQQAALKALESIPDLLNLAMSLVDIKKTAVQADSVVKVIREQGEFLQKQADVLVKTEIARRNSLATKSEAIQGLLQDLYGSLNTLQTGDEVKLELIGLVNRSIQILLEDKDNEHEK
ncbi:hypothetical protein [Paenibacillus sp. 37]|uniref:hypothetical protein n=1 Tax=Paenibacillus sp. 37 TaxID=2607911 RepID=UPI00122E9947|nr:hypothetical protein [Paenibacillus sp. 37]